MWRRRPGRFLLTGSANLLFLPKVTESLAGRMEIVQLQPLTEAEKERKPGRFLSALLEGSLKPSIRGRTGGVEPGLAERLVAGGYPEPLGRAALADLTSTDWLDRRDRMGYLLESFVVQQLIAQAAWTDVDLRFWHYRDKDQVEVDIVMTRGRKVWGIEVKAAASLTRRDGQGLARLSDRCGKDFEGGILLYAGLDCLPLGGKRMLAVPLNELWTR